MGHWFERLGINHERARPGRILLGQRSLPALMSVTQGIVQKLAAELTHAVHIDTMCFGHTKILGKNQYNSPRVRSRDCPLNPPVSMIRLPVGSLKVWRRVAQVSKACTKANDVPKRQSGWPPHLVPR